MSPPNPTGPTSLTHPFFHLYAKPYFWSKIATISTSGTVNNSGVLFKDHKKLNRQLT